MYLGRQLLWQGHWHDHCWRAKVKENSKKNGAFLKNVPSFLLLSRLCCFRGNRCPELQLTVAHALWTFSSKGLRSRGFKRSRSCPIRVRGELTSAPNTAGNKRGVFVFDTTPDHSEECQVSLYNKLMWLWNNATLQTLSEVSQFKHRIFLYLSTCSLLMCETLLF